MAAGAATEVPLSPLLRGHFSRDGGFGGGGGTNSDEGEDRYRVSCDGEEGEEIGIFLLVLGRGGGGGIVSATLDSLPLEVLLAALILSVEFTGEPVRGGGGGGLLLWRR